MQIHCSTRSVIFNVSATQYTCLLNGVWLPPLTSTVTSSLLTGVHSSPLSLAARLHRCHAPSHYINNGWTFSRQTSLKYSSFNCHLVWFKFRIRVSYVSFIKGNFLDLSLFQPAKFFKFFLSSYVFAFSPTVMCYTNMS